MALPPADGSIVRELAVQVKNIEDSITSFFCRLVTVTQIPNIVVRLLGTEMAETVD